MKTPSQDLFQLIKALTKTEKRYIKINAGSNDLIYMQLMDAISKQMAYDESTLVQENLGAAFVKNLAVNKRYLYQLILKMLTRYQKADLIAEIREKLIYARVLWQKTLNHQAYKMLQSCKKLAHRVDAFELLPDILKLEKQIIGQAKGKELNLDDLEALYLEEKKCNEQLVNINEYWFLKNQLALNQVKMQKASTEKQRNKLSRIFEDDRLQNIHFAKALESKVYFFQANATYFFTIGEVGKALDFNRRLLKLLEENPFFLNRKTELYFASLNNYLIDCFHLERHYELEEGLKKLKNLTDDKNFQKIKNLKARIFRQQFLLELNIFLSEKNIQKGIVLLPELEEGLKKFKTQIPKHERLTLHYLAANFLFQNKALEKAQTWLLPIVQETKEQAVSEIYAFSRLLNLLIHFDLEHFRLLESLLISTRRYLKNRRQLYETEVSLFQFFKKWVEIRQKKEKQILLKETIFQIEKLSKNPAEARVFQYIDLVSWLKNKLENRF